MTELDRLRIRGIQIIVGIGWAANIVVAILGITRGLADGLQIIAAGCMVMAIPSVQAQRCHHDLSARLSVGVATALMPALLLYAMRGAAWQLDMHMYFFVALAALTILCDWRPLLLSGAIIAVHHMALSLTEPSWVFSGGGGLERVMIHALAVTLQCAILAYIAVRLQATIRAQTAARVESEAMAAQSAAAAARAEDALAAARRAEERAAEEQRRRQQLESDAATRRRRDFVALADRFETSVTGVADAVDHAAGALKRSAGALNEVAVENDRHAIEVATVTHQLSHTTRSVADQAHSMSDAIDRIVDNIARQARLNEHARTQSMRGGEAVQALATTSLNVGGLADGIATIAQQTNLLALNATIEAARAGAVGQGFAVVANEVKQLARQAGGASERISELAHGVNQQAGLANRNFDEVVSAIEDVSTAANAIAQAIDAQRRAAQVIQGNARDAAASMTDMERQAACVTESAMRANQLSTEVNDAAASLVEQLATLKDATKGFVATLKAA